MVRRYGPECPSGHHKAAQKRVYIKVTLDYQRIVPLAWLCLDCGILHDYEDSFIQDAKGGHWPIYYKIAKPDSQSVDEMKEDWR